MSDAARPDSLAETGLAPSGSPAADWRGALLVTLLMQVALSFLTQSMAVLGPSLTAAAGVVPELVGHVASAVSIGTLWFLMGGILLLNSLGPVRLLQYGVILGAGGLLLALTGFWPVVMVAALAVGFGYGPAPPAGNEILARTAPKRHRSLIFSIKQSGAPLGYALAGLLLPPLSVAFGWQAALVVGALLAGACVLVVEPFRAGIDHRQGALRVASFRALFDPAMVLTPFRTIGRSPALVRLAYSGAAMSMVQGSAFALFVTFLNVDLGVSLTAAGSAFAVMQIAGAGGRVGCGWLADRLGSATLLVGILALGSSAIMAVVAAMNPSWPWLLVLAVSAATGLLSASWNGVLLAEISHLSPPDKVGESTSAATFFIFTGYVLGPALVSTIIRFTGSYAAGFLTVAVLPLSAAALLLPGRARQSRPDHT